MENVKGENLRLSFSGGGYRATFYSLGACRRLVELGLWERVSRIDSVSGGSMTAAAIMMALTEAKFKDVTDFDKRVTGPLKKLGQSCLRERITWPVYIIVLASLLIYVWLQFSLRLQTWPSWLAYTVFLSLLIAYVACLLFWIRPSALFSRNLLNILEKDFAKGKLMNSLSPYPTWCAQTTCLNTGKRYRFKQSDFGGNKVGVTEENNIKVGFAVACSAAFPPVFAPFKLDQKGKTFYDKWWEPRIKWELIKDPLQNVFLSDGGVYDNLGSENILQQKEEEDKVPFIILDAGTYIPQWSAGLNPHWFENTARIIATSLDQIIALRRRIIYAKTICVELGQTPGTILILGKEAQKYLDQQTFQQFGNLSSNITPTVDMPQYDLFQKEIETLISDIRTDLDSFHDLEIESLMWAGAVRMDIAVKRYLKQSLTEQQFKDTPKKPDYGVDKLKKILAKDKKRHWIWYFIGFLHRNLKDG